MVYKVGVYDRDGNGLGLNGDLTIPALIRGEFGSGFCGIGQV